MAGIHGRKGIFKVGTCEKFLLKSGLQGKPLSG